MIELRKFKAEILKALAHPARIQIVDALRDGEHSVGELSDILGVQSSSVSQQLSILRSRNLVNTRKDGNIVFYSITDPVIFNLLDNCRQIFENHLITLQSHVKKKHNSVLSLWLILSELINPLLEGLEVLPWEFCA